MIETHKLETANQILIEKKNNCTFNDWQKKKTVN